MRYAVDADQVAGLGSVVTAAARAVGPVDLTGVAQAVAEGMPGSLSAQLVDVVADLQDRLRAALLALEAEGGHLRLAAEQYAAADRVVAAAAHVSAGPGR
jgi:hypothetical protein